MGGGAGSFGGGAYFFDELTIVNIFYTVAYGNSADYGGGIRVMDSTANIKNAILWENTADQVANNGGILTVSYSDIQNGYEGTGNISLNPIFLSAPDDFRTVFGSPCIDTGDCAGGPDDDFEGISRPQGAGCDMGSYEYGAVFVDSFESSDTSAWSVVFP